MNNKTLAIFTLIPMWTIGLSGAFGIYTNDTFEAMLGLAMIVFTTWACIRLYKIKD